MPPPTATLGTPRRRRGQRLAIIGIGTAVAGSVIISAGDPYDEGNAAGIIGALVTVGGAGTFWYGVWNWYKGAEELGDLDREGRMKGYLSLAPRPQGFHAAVTLKF